MFKLPFIEIKHINGSCRMVFNNEQLKFLHAVHLRYKVEINRDLRWCQRNAEHIKIVLV